MFKKNVYVGSDLVISTDENDKIVAVILPRTEREEDGSVVLASIENGEFTPMFGGREDFVLSTPIEDYNIDSLILKDIVESIGVTNVGANIAEGIPVFVSHIVAYGEIEDDAHEGVAELTLEPRTIVTADLSQQYYFTSDREEWENNDNAILIDCGVRVLDLTNVGDQVSIWLKYFSDFEQQLSSQIDMMIPSVLEMVDSLIEGLFDINSPEQQEMAGKSLANFMQKFSQGPDTSRVNHLALEKIMAASNSIDDVRSTTHYLITPLFVNYPAVEIKDLILSVKDSLEPETFELYADLIEWASEE